ncbi:hypothetical protein BAUCODRAFT_123447 [Baudoinia panamericana UAMH 10762]|uniref:DUF202 domain-containing protein n=1 Tax=Baudoinia panamericana (strain UAMH 10762) TaxID=717646 RepID=M2N7A6_BAUPA|nr:uncharacterized protein BAUCODRAFT_123447 [Baudoinia panamericana UAMH 10762]EMC94954.1 hypothetical protein BAUCODRAFT_123447 [Baudoinia panamericana UAMH 10762]
MRTSVALSMLSITIAQLYRLQPSVPATPAFGFFALSKPLAAIFQAAAITVSLLGASRFYRQQHAMAVGKVRVRGWEVWVICVGVPALLLLLFIVHLGAD